MGPPTEHSPEVDWDEASEPHAGVQALLRARGAVAVRGRDVPPRAGAGRDHGGRPGGDGGAVRRPRLRQFRQCAGRLGAGRLRLDVRAGPAAALGGSGRCREHHRRRPRPSLPGPGRRREGAGPACRGVRRGTDPATAGSGLQGRSAARVLGRQPGPPPEPGRRSPGGVCVRHPSAERGDPTAPPGSHHPRRPRGPRYGQPPARVVPRGRSEGAVVDRGLRATGRREDHPAARLVCRDRPGGGAGHLRDRTGAGSGAVGRRASRRVLVGSASRFG